MALQDAPAWVEFFINAKIPPTEAERYATIFAENRITGTLLPELTKELLYDLGIKVLGDALAILQHAKHSTQSVDPPPQDIPDLSSRIKAPSAKLPQLTADMTLPQFRKFKIDWDVFKRITHISGTQIHAQLYSCCDEATQNSIVNTINDIFSVTEETLLKTIEEIVTKHSNPTVHRMHFGSLTQEPNETVKEFLIRLKSAAKDCEFTCPNCNTDLQPIHVKDQFIRGLSNDVLQTDILAKASQLKSLETIIKHSEAFEAAMRDQHKLQSSDIHAFRSSTYKKNQSQAPNIPDSDKKKHPCAGCGSLSHGQKGSKDRPTHCPAWGTTCHNCQIPNHFARVCRKKKEHVGGLIAKLSNNTNIEQIDVTLKPCLAHHHHGVPNSVTMKVFPDSGASICLAGPQHITALDLSTDELIPCSKTVTAVGGSQIKCMGWLPMSFSIGNHTTKQPLFISDKADRIYLSRKGCTELQILPPSFPYPMPAENINSFECHTQQTDIAKESRELPQRPSKIPYPPTEENVPKLKQFLVDTFKETAFNKSTPFPAMETKPVHIHLKENAVPHAHHVPIPVPFHWKEKVKQDLDMDVQREIITPVPIGTPVKWCSKMIVTAKKNGNPRRVVDFQKLNAQCLRETHHCPSPFQAACQVPANSKKTVFDAVDGYHSIKLDEESQPLTTFISEWGRHMYLRLPQGYLAAGDAYTRRFDELISDLPRKVKIVDDCLLWDLGGIEESFFHAWDFLYICAKNNIVVNLDKFQFCQDTVEYSGLKLTPSGVTPSDKMLSAIRDFPSPKILTDARSWFGLVNQVAWAYSISSIMEPFRELIKANNTFHWDDVLENLFQKSKSHLLSKVMDGIRAFDVNRQTCLQPDWCQNGIGYLLLQKYCTCSLEKAPVCCPDGWRLVYAGSRFTQESESNYSPTEGEALAVTYALNHAKNFVLGCPNLIIVTDHESLLGIFNDCDLQSITNPRISKLKEKTFRFKFTIQHCPGKWHRGPDACSRNPSPLLALSFAKPELEDITSSNEIDEHVLALDENTMAMLNHNIDVASLKDSCLITLEQIKMHAQTDSDYQSLIKLIKEGFPCNKSEVDNCLREYWEVRDRLSTHDGIALMNKRIVIPKMCRKPILQSLHAAHQGVTGMQSRANQTVYWPGLHAAIKNHKQSCQSCIEISPKQSQEPLILSPPPEYPFQQICADYFEHESHSYLSIVDRFSYWLNIYHFSNSATSSSLIAEFRKLFGSYGVSEEISSDGGPQFTSSSFQQFLKNWGVNFRISSAQYPQSNGRAELAVKTAKRIIMDNTIHGSLNTDKVILALLQYRNTPIPHIGLSPAQILFHRQLRDHLPNNPYNYRLHKRWLLAANQRENLLSQRNKQLQLAYNQTAHELSSLSIGDTVVILDPTSHKKRKWIRTGTIVEILPFRQYRIKMHGSGRVCLRNRRFLKPIGPINHSYPHISPTNFEQNPAPAQTAAKDAPQIEAPAPATTHANQHLPQPGPAPIPRALKRLQDFNSPGLKE